MDVKSDVLRGFLAFVARHVPLSEARVATLGGQGLEPTVWAEAGIPFNHGWIIERNRRQKNALIGAHRYRSVNQMATLDRILAGLGPEDAHIDAFHLDLCGTLTSSTLLAFDPVVPLVLKSAGRCLAVTVADQRGKNSLDHWWMVEEEGAKYFGAYATKCLEELVAQQSKLPVNKDLPKFMTQFDPEKGARREYAFLLEMVRLFFRQKKVFLPNHIERYVYVSHYQRRAFRMRTYFFHLEPTPDSTLDLPVFTDRWVHSPLSFQNGDVVTTIISTNPKPPIGASMTSAPSRLALLAEAAGPEAKAELAALLSDSKQLADIRATLIGAGMISTPHGSKSNGHAKPNGTGHVAAKSVPSGRKKYSKLTVQEQIEWLLSTLEYKKSVNGEFNAAAWQKLVAKSFGRYSAPLGRSLRSALARTTGKFRANFRQRIVDAFPGDEARPYLDRLAKL